MLYAFKAWRRRHVTPAGLMAVSVFFICSMAGGSVLKTQVYQLGVLMFVCIIIAAIATLFPFRIQLDVKRQQGRYAICGQPWDYAIQITNLTSKPQKGLILFDEISDPRPDFKTLMRSREPHEDKRNAWDRRVLYYRWQWLVERKKKIESLPRRVPDIRPGETVTVELSQVPTSRGWISFAGVSISRPDVLGLFCRCKSISLRNRILVLPKMIPVPSVSLTSSRKFQPGGVNLASSIGNSDEFMALRPYRPGDPMRNVHWRSFAKTSQLVIKEFEDEHFIRYALILDTFSRVQDHDLFENAVSAAASYAARLRGPESILDLLFVGHRIYSFSAGRGIGQLPKLLEVLACVEPAEKGSVKALMPVLSSHIRAISGSICIFLGWNADHVNIYTLFEKNRVDARFIVVCRDSEQMRQRIHQTTVQPGRVEVVQI